MALLALWALLHMLVAHADPQDAHNETCEQKMQSWIEEQQELYPVGRPADASQLLYFLHVPRTAGRTTHSCMLRPASPPSRRCAKSYDGFKYNISVPNCGLFSSHDDFSAMRFLPKESAVITTIRNPVDRFLSAYEFAAELGARPPPASNQQPRPDRTRTEDVWPWSHLQPFFFKDIHAKRQQRAAKAAEHPILWKKLKDSKGREYYWNSETKQSKWTLPEGTAVHGEGEPLDAYDNELMMSLREFAEHPIAHELLHNGQLLQASELRACIRSDPDTQHLALEYAKERLSDMLFVGVFERLHTSISTMASATGVNISQLAWRSDTANAFSYDMSDDEADENKPEDDMDPELPKTQKEITAMLRTLRESLNQTVLAAGGDTAADSDGEDEAEEADEAADGATGEQDEEAAAAAKRKAEIQDMRRMIGRLNKQLALAREAERIIHVNEAKGYARQLIPDDSFLMNLTVAQNYVNCEEKANSRGKQKRERIFAKLQTSTGQTIQFSRAAREQIPAPVLEEIETLNWMDMELHRYAETLHDVTLQLQKSDGSYQDLEAVRREAPQPLSEEQRKKLQARHAAQQARGANKENDDPAKRDEL